MPPFIEFYTAQCNTFGKQNKRQAASSIDVLVC